jgi:hypothetical protein
MKRLYFWLLLFLPVSLNCLAHEVILAKPKSEKDPRQAYVYTLLNTALNYKQTETARTNNHPHSYTVTYSEKVHSRERIKVLMMEGRSLDIQATATRPDWENDLLVIRIPIYKGLLGYRILLIHKDSQPKFSAITHIDQLKAMDAVLGSQWSITPVWKGYGFKTITNVDYESLFKIINFERADYFPRGANEVLQEYNQFFPTYTNLAIEEDLAIYLPLPMYFFVTPHKPELAKHLEHQLERMVTDGEFDHLFFKHFGTKIHELKMSKRRTFFLNNPKLPEATPLHRKELWYKNTVR